MKTFAFIIMQDSYFGAIVKWVGISILLVMSAYIINELHQKKLQEISVNSTLLKKKSLLVSQMHNKMLAISRTQLQILHSSNNEQVRQNLHQLTQLISDHLIHYYQLQLITDESDTKMLDQFKISFKKWQSFNENLLGYANVVSDAGFINTLNKIDFALTQFNVETDEKQLLIAHLKQNAY